MSYSHQYNSSMVAPLLGLATKKEDNSTFNNGWSSSPGCSGAYANPRYAPSISDTVETNALDGTTTGGSYKDKGFSYKNEGHMTAQANNSCAPGQRCFQNNSFGCRTFTNKPAEELQMPGNLDEVIAEMNAEMHKIQDGLTKEQGSFKAIEAHAKRPSNASGSMYENKHARIAKSWNAQCGWSPECVVLPQKEVLLAQKNSLQVTCKPLDIALSSAEKVMAESIKFSLTLIEQCELSITLAHQSKLQFEQVYGALNLQKSSYIQKCVGYQIGKEVK